jgi:hypothetical protein
MKSNEKGVNPPQGEVPVASEKSQHIGTLQKPNLDDLWSVAYLPGSKV